MIVFLVLQVKLLVLMELPAWHFLGQVSQCCARCWQRAVPSADGELVILGDNVGWGRSKLWTESAQGGRRRCRSKELLGGVGRACRQIGNNNTSLSDRCLQLGLQYWNSGCVSVLWCPLIGRGSMIAGLTSFPCFSLTNISHWGNKALQMRQKNQVQEKQK